MNREMSYGDDYKYIPATSIESGVGIEVLSDVYCHTIQIVNIALIGEAGSDDFVLIDAGMPKSADEISAVIENRQSGNKPKAIILTHGHFDHVGGIVELVKKWDVPVYAHQLEIPFLTGEKNYPEPDPTVEGGMVAKISSYFPNEPINLGTHVEPLPSDGTVPHLKDFRWIHTPGHTPGHVSFYRESDGVLIAGDAFITVEQENFFDVALQHKEISGPPKYFTTDWDEAKKSVGKLAELNPRFAVTGHGMPMSGDELKENLTLLVNKFDKIAVPKYGKYVDRNRH